MLLIITLLATVGEFINQAGATITAIGECNLVATTS